MRTFKLVLALTILVLLFIFSAFNAQPVHIQFFGLQTGDLPLFLPILFCFALGFLVAALLGTLRISQLRRQVHQLEKQADLARKAGIGPGDQAGNGSGKV